MAQAITAAQMAGKFQKAATDVGWPIIIIGWIIAGILYLTSAGSPEKAGTARKALMYAIIGTVIVILATNACSFISTLFGLGAQC